MAELRGVAWSGRGCKDQVALQVTLPQSAQRSDIAHALRLKDDRWRFLAYVGSGCDPPLSG